MVDETTTKTLSVAAQARRAADLPGLLAVVRRRGRWRRARRVGLLVAAGGLAVAAWRWRGNGEPAAVQVVPPQAAAPAAAPVAPQAWRIVHDDPRVLARCLVATTPRSDWLVDDAELQALLGEAGRPRGLVRVGAVVAVAPEAIDRP